MGVNNLAIRMSSLSSSQGMPLQYPASRAGPEFMCKYVVKEDLETRHQRHPFQRLPKNSKSEERLKTSINTDKYCTGHLDHVPMSMMDEQPFQPPRTVWKINEGQATEYCETARRDMYWDYSQ